MIEREVDEVTVNDHRLYTYIWKKEEYQSGLEADQVAPGLRPPPVMTRRVVPESMDDGFFIREDENTTVVNIGDNDEIEVDATPTVSLVTHGNGSPPFKFDTTLEKKEKALFGNPPRKPKEHSYSLVPTETVDSETNHRAICCSRNNDLFLSMESLHQPERAV